MKSVNSSRRDPRLYQFISLLSYDTLSKEKHIKRNSYFVCGGFERQQQRRKNWRRAVTPDEFWQNFLSFQILQVFCYNFICLSGRTDILWHVSSWDAAGNKREEPAEMFRADLERAKAIKKLGGLGAISLWTETAKPRSRITPVSGKFCANRGQGIIFAFENNHTFSIFLLPPLHPFFFPGNLFPEGTFHEGWHSSLFFFLHWGK